MECSAGFVAAGAYYDSLIVVGLLLVELADKKGGHDRDWVQSHESSPSTLLCLSVCLFLCLSVNDAGLVIPSLAERILILRVKIFKHLESLCKNKVRSNYLNSNQSASEYLP